MSVPDSTSKSIQSCNGSAVAFPFTFGIGATSEIKVTYTTALGVETVLTETTHYVVSATNNDYSSGGTVTTVATYASGTTITLERNVPYTQEADFTEGMVTLYETFEDGLDKLTRILQQQRVLLDRALLASTVESLDMTLPAASVRANKMLGFDATGKPVALSDVTGGVTFGTIGNALLASSTESEARTVIDVDSKAEVTSEIGAAITAVILDEDDLVSNSATKVPSQQSVKAYADAIKLEYSNVTQTVLSSKITSGLPAFIVDPNDGLHVHIVTDTGSSPIIISFSAGFDSTGQISYMGVIDADTYIATLTDDATNFLYAERNSGTGAITLGKVAVAPVYQNVAPTHAANLYWFSIPEMKMYLSNGTDTWTAKQIVFLGEAVTSGGEVTSVVNYALRGEYISADTTFASAGTKMSFNHNIGAQTGVTLEADAVNVTNEGGWITGEIAKAVLVAHNVGAYVVMFPSHGLDSRNGASFTTGATYVIVVVNKANGQSAGVDGSKWKLRMTAKRGW